MFFGGGRTIKNIFYTGVIIAAMFFYWNIAQTETQTGNINVNMNVPSIGNHCTNGIQDADETGVDCGGTLCSSCGGSGGGGNGTIYYAPVISNVEGEATFYQAVISWDIDFKDISGNNTTSIFYGKNNFNSTAIVTVSGTKFSAILDNLDTDTNYDFKIIAANSSLGSEVTGQIKTQKATILKSLTILAKPEKRDLKNGANYGAEATLFFLDQNANMILSDFTTVLGNTGSTTISNIEVPEGSNLVAILKTNAHLAKRLNGVITTGETLVLDFTVNRTFELLAGDMAGTIDAIGSENLFSQFLQAERQDDFVDILDISTVVSKFNNQQTGERTNLNRDNIVDAQDISMVLGNWNKKGNIILE